MALLFYTLFDLKNQVRQIPELRKTIDSLQQELFIKQTDAGRHELIRETYLKSKHPKVYEDYHYQFETDTE